MSGLRISTTVVLSIVATGALLNLASSGLFGKTIQDASNYVIRGYGV